MDLRRRAYARHKNIAKFRGIEWDFTFEEWLEVWGDKIKERGRGSDQLCMARKGDEGPYAIWNVVIKTNRENIKEKKFNPKTVYRPPSKHKLPEIRVIYTKK
jgi:hypothetical protein